MYTRSVFGQLVWRNIPASVTLPQDSSSGLRIPGPALGLLPFSHFSRKLRASSVDFSVSVVNARGKILPECSAEKVFA